MTVFSQWNKLSVTCGKYHVNGKLKCHSDRVNIHSHAAFKPFKDEEDTPTPNSVYCWTNVSIASDLYLVYLRIKDCLNLEYRAKIYQKQFRYWSLHWVLFYLLFYFFVGRPFEFFIQCYQNHQNMLSIWRPILAKK